MPKAPPRAWTQRDCRFDYLVGAAADAGYGQTVTMDGIADAPRALDIKRGIYRCAGHRGISGYVEWRRGADWHSHAVMWPPDKEADGTYVLRFAVFDKRAARKRHIQVHGTDRSKWPYNPRAGKSAADIAAWQEQGLNEKGHRVR